MNNKDKENAQIIKDAVNDDISLPQSLSKENIEKLVRGEKQKSSKKGIIRRFVAVGVAACIVLAVGTVLKNSSSKLPGSVLPGENTQGAQTGADSFSSYDDLISHIRAYAEEIEKDREVYFYASDDMLVEGAADVKEESTVVLNSSMAGGASQNKGELNLRVEGVYEEDVFINDGEYFYYIDSDMNIVIVKAEKDGRLTKVSVIENTYPEMNYINYNGLYRYKDYLIACYSRQQFPENKESGYNIINTSGAVIFDVSDKTQPKEIKNIALDGYTASSRITDGKLILISTHSIIPYYSYTDDGLLLPAVYNGAERKTVACDCIIYNEEDAPESYVIVSSLNLEDITKEEQTISFLGSTSDTYCTKDTLYILGRDFSNNGMVSYSFRFFTTGFDTVITSVDITGDKPVYKNRTTVDGSILDSYSIDEYNGYLRLAVTDTEENAVVVLDKELKEVGRLSGIAKGEQIKSARFMGDTLYLVTFVQTDPLFVIDLSKPSEPEIKGEVKLPGFSSYLHPVGEGLLVGIGYGGTEDGLDGSAKISLFDVSDPASPKETDAFVLPDAQFEVNPKAYTAVSENSFLIPYNVWEKTQAGYVDGRYRTGALLMEVSDNKLTVKTDYCVRSEMGTSRATFIEDIVYIFEAYSGMASFERESGKFITAFTVSDDDIYNYEP